MKKYTNDCIHNIDDNFHCDPRYDIGVITYKNTVLENTIGYINFGGQIQNCKVSVYGRGDNGIGERDVPHFHIVSNGKSKKNRGGKNFQCCICIYEAKYFDHGYSTDILDNTSDKKILRDWLNSKWDDELNVGNLTN